MKDCKTHCFCFLILTLQSQHKFIIKTDPYWWKITKNRWVIFLLLIKLFACLKVPNERKECKINSNLSEDPWKICNIVLCLFLSLASLHVVTLWRSRLLYRGPWTGLWSCSNIRENPQHCTGHQLSFSFSCLL